MIENLHKEIYDTPLKWVSDSRILGGEMIAKMNVAFPPSWVFLWSLKIIGGEGTIQRTWLGEPESPIEDFISHG